MPAIISGNVGTKIRDMNVYRSRHTMSNLGSVICLHFHSWVSIHLAVGQNQWDPILGKVNSPPILEPILVVGLGCSLGVRFGF